MATIELDARPARGKARVRGAVLRHADEPAFVLHTWPYKETSLIVDALTRNHGRIALVARGAKRPHSLLRGILQGFAPLTLSWTGSRSKPGELHNLTRAEWQGGIAPLRGEALLCGFYLNELILKLLARDDAHETLFDAYATTLERLAGGAAVAPTLREFEHVLLREVGYGMPLDACADGTPVSAEANYSYRPDEGPVPAQRVVARGEVAALYSGKTLLDIAAGDFSDPATLAQGKLLMRQVLQHHLAGQTLFTRQMIMDLQNL